MSLLLLGNSQDFLNGMGDVGVTSNACLVKMNRGPGNALPRLPHV